MIITTTPTPYYKIVTAVKQRELRETPTPKLTRAVNHRLKMKSIRIRLYTVQYFEALITTTAVRTPTRHC